MLIGNWRRREPVDDGFGGAHSMGGHASL